jgi:DNA-binding transcriptional MerR regulator
MEVFELGEIAKILGMPLTKAKNWTIGRPFTIEPSIKTASGHGSRNLYSLDDLYLMGLANELSKAGMAANAIGKLVEAVKAKFPGGLSDVETLFVSRGPKLAYRIETREDRVPADAVVRVVIDVRGLRDRIDREVARLRRG